MRQVLWLLRDGRFHSGEALAEALGISRAAVWKRIQALEADLCLKIHRVRGRGYCLAQPYEPLQEALLQACCDQFGWQLQLLDTVESTNTQALRAVQASGDRPQLVLAEQQTQGRGRRGRAWQSPYGCNLYFSLGLRVEPGELPLDGLSLTVGLAVLRVVQAFGCRGAGLKWPNDLLVEGHKLSGVLLELSGNPQDGCDLVIGIGLNVNMSAQAVEAGQPWTSLQLLLGGTQDRTALAVALCEQLQRYLARHAAEGFAGLREEWQTEHAWQGCEVRLLAGSTCMDGQVLGVDDGGGLRLLVDGREQLFNGGEISLRLRDDS